MFIKSGLNLKICKVASVSNLHVIANDIPELKESLDKISIKKDDNFVYFWTRAITADVPNLNADYFPLEELRASYPTFIGRGLYLDHNANSVANAVGKVFDAKLLEDPLAKEGEGKYYVGCLCGVDKTTHPDIAAKVAHGVIDSVSMGCNCTSCKCSICGKVCNTPEDFCIHLQHQGQIDPETGKKCCSINMGVNFTELSLVGVPADPMAKMQQVFAKKENNLPKTAEGLDQFVRQDQPSQEVWLNHYFFNIECANDKVAQQIYNILSNYDKSGIKDLQCNNMEVKVSVEAQDENVALNRLNQMFNEQGFDVMEPIKPQDGFENKASIRNLFIKKSSNAVTDNSDINYNIEKYSEKGENMPEENQKNFEELGKKPAETGIKEPNTPKAEENKEESKKDPAKLVEETITLVEKVLNSEKSEAKEGEDEAADIADLEKVQKNLEEAQKALGSKKEQPKKSTEEEKQQVKEEAQEKLDNLPKSTDTLNKEDKKSSFKNGLNKKAYTSGVYNGEKINPSEIINPKNDGDVYLVKITSEGDHTTYDYPVKAYGFDEAIDTVFKWAYTHDGRNDVIFDKQYIKSNYPEDIEEGWIDSAKWVENEDYNLFALADGFSVEFVPQDFIDNKKSSFMSKLNRIAAELEEMKKGLDMEPKLEEKKPLDTPKKEEKKDDKAEAIKVLEEAIKVGNKELQVALDFIKKSDKKEEKKDDKKDNGDLEKKDIKKEEKPSLDKESLEKEAAIDGGWEVKEEEAKEKALLWKDTVGADKAFDDLMLALSTSELAACMAFIFRTHDFTEGLSKKSFLNKEAAETPITEHKVKVKELEKNPIKDMSDAVTLEEGEASTTYLKGALTHLENLMDQISQTKALLADLTQQEDTAINTLIKKVKETSDTAVVLGEKILYVTQEVKHKSYSITQKDVSEQLNIAREVVSDFVKKMTEKKERTETTTLNIVKRNSAVDNDSLILAAEKTVKALDACIETMNNYIQLLDQDIANAEVEEAGYPEDTSFMPAFANIDRVSLVKTAELKDSSWVFHFKGTDKVASLPVSKLMNATQSTAEQLTSEAFYNTMMSTLEEKGDFSPSTVKSIVANFNEKVKVEKDEKSSSISKATAKAKNEKDGKAVASVGGTTSQTMTDEGKAQKSCKTNTKEEASAAETATKKAPAETDIKVSAEYENKLKALQASLQAKEAELAQIKLQNKLAEKTEKCRQIVAKSIQCGLVKCNETYRQEELVKNASPVKAKEIAMKRTADSMVSDLLALSDEELDKQASYLSNFKVQAEVKQLKPIKIEASDKSEEMSIIEALSAEMM